MCVGEEVGGVYPSHIPRGSERPVPMAALANQGLHQILILTIHDHIFYTVSTVR